MKIWVISLMVMAAAGAALHFIVGEDLMWQFLSGYLFGAPLGALFVTFIWHDTLKNKGRLTQEAPMWEGG